VRSSLPDRPVVETVFLDVDGKVVRRVEHGRAPLPPVGPAPPPRPRPAAPPLQPPPNQQPLQRGEADGISVEVYPLRSRLLPSTGARQPRAAPARRDERLRRLHQARDLPEPNRPPGAHRVEAVRADADAAAGRARVADAALRRLQGPRLVRPQVGDAARHRKAGEIPFNDRPRRFFDEQELARKLAYFVRSPRMVEARRALKRGGSAPPARSVAAAYGADVVALAGWEAAPGGGTIGIWSDGRRTLEAAAWTGGGRIL
jgi:hypothetical protein